MKSNVVFLPGWRQVKDKAEEIRLENLQKEFEIFHAEIEYQYGDLEEWMYNAEKEMAHIRIRQVMTLVKK